MSKREAALIGWEQEFTGEYRNQWDAGNYDWAPDWEAYADHCDITTGFIPNMGTVLICKGGATLEVGNVGAEAIVIVAGGGANITINGDVGYGTKILASGGGATVRVRGTVHPTAIVRALGGGAHTFIGG